MRWYIPVVIALATLLIYGNTLNADFVWDDLLFIKGKSPIQQLENIPAFFTSDISWGTSLPHATPYYRPLYSTMMALQYSLWGADSVGYHLVNLLLHTGIAILVYLLARRFMLSDSASIGAALIYTVHPAHAEGVAYLGSSSELQYTLFCLAAILFYLRYRESLKSSDIFAAIFCYFFALFTKESALTLPLLLLVLEVTFPKGTRWQKVARVSAVAAVTVLYLVDRFQYVKEMAWQANPLLDRVYTSIGIVARYVWNLVAPFELKVLYDIPLKLSFFRTDVVLPLLGLLALFWALLFSFRKSRRVFFFSSWIFIGLLPASGLPALLLPAPMADRYLTISLVGYAILAGILYDELKARFDGDGASWKVSKVTVSFALLCLVLGAITAKRNLIWQNHETLVRRMIADAPEHFLGYELLGTLEGGKGNYSAMADSYYKAEQKTLVRNLALAREYLALWRLEESVAAFERLMKKFSHDPQVLNGMGEALVMKGKPFEAIAFFRQGALICPTCTDITANLRKLEKSGSWQNK